MHDDYDLRQEQLNKASLLFSKKFLENLLEKFNSHVVSQVLKPIASSVFPNCCGNNHAWLYLSVSRYPGLNAETME